jgi:hypothetical protein
LRWAVAAACGALPAASDPAAARAIAERYDVPLPSTHLVAGLIAAVVAAIAVATVFSVRPPRPGGTRHLHPLETLCPLAHSVRGYGVAIFLLVIAAGLFGHEHPARNIAPAMVWIGFWVAFGLLCTFVADVWPLLNPWRTLFFLTEMQRYRRRAHRTMRPYPARLREWPAVVALSALVWIATAAPFASHPFWLAACILLYSVVTFVGMAIFGREAWLNHGEAFTVLFQILGRFAPMRLEGAERKGGAVALRPWGAGLLRDAAPSTATVAFVLLLLSAVLFDALLGTGLWRWLEPRLPAGSMLAPTIGLLATALVIGGAYLAACAAMRRGDSATIATARAYGFTLVPIIAGANLARHMPTLLVQAQDIIRLASDPFGLDWNLFGSATLTPEIDVVGPGTTWSVALGAIFGGHVIALWLAHQVALRDGRARALVPLLILITILTGLSLAILAEPLARFPADDVSAVWLPHSS